MTELDIASLGALTVNPERMAIIASYSPTPRVSRSLRELVREIGDAGYQTILVRASEDPAPLDWDPPHDAVTIVRRPNVAYDFGSWGAILTAVPRARTARHVLLANDSLVGPFFSMGKLIGHFESSTADAWGAVANAQVVVHLQSFLLGFRSGILNDPPLREFWRRIRPQAEKMDYVRKYELGLHRALWSESYAMQAAHPYGTLGLERVNPTLDRWRELIEHGFPFVKRALLTDVEDPARRAKVASFVASHYGSSVEEWM